MQISQCFSLLLFVFGQAADPACQGGACRKSSTNYLLQQRQHLNKSISIAAQHLVSQSNVHQPKDDGEDDLDVYDPNEDNSQSSCTLTPTYYPRGTKGTAYFLPVQKKTCDSSAGKVKKSKVYTMGTDKEDWECFQKCADFWTKTYKQSCCAWDGKSGMCTVLAVKDDVDPALFFKDDPDGSDCAMASYTLPMGVKTQKDKTTFVYPGHKMGVPIKHWGIDIMQQYRAGMVTEKWAQELFVTQGFNLIRAAIYLLEYPAHPSEGVVNDSWYDTEWKKWENYAVEPGTDCPGPEGTSCPETLERYAGKNGGGGITSIQNALKAVPEVQVMIGLKLNPGTKGNAFPPWCVEEGTYRNPDVKPEVIPEKLAIAVADTLEMYAKHSIPCHLLGLDEETTRITPEVFVEAMGNLTELAAKRGISWTTVQGPSWYQPHWTWAVDVEKLGGLHHLTHNGYHYYGMAREEGQMPELFKLAAQAKRNKLPLIHSELHMLTTGKVRNKRSLDNVEDMIAHFTDCNVAGTEDFVWWAYGDLDNFDCPLKTDDACRHFESEVFYWTTQSSPVGSQLVLVDDYDGRHHDWGSFHTAAWRTGSRLVMWLISNSPAFEITEGAGHWRYAHGEEPSAWIDRLPKTPCVEHPNHKIQLVGAKASSASYRVWEGANIATGESATREGIVLEEDGTSFRIDMPCLAWYIITFEGVTDLDVHSSYQTTSFLVYEDTYVFKNKPDTVFGKETSLVMQGVGSKYERMTFLKFDVTGLSGYIANATLQVTTEPWQDALSEVLVVPVSNDWKEETLTYNTAPHYDSHMGFLSAVVDAAEEAVLEFDVTMAMKQNHDDTFYSFVIMEPKQEKSKGKFYSKEAGRGKAPRLMISTL